MESTARCIILLTLLLMLSTVAWADIKAYVAENYVLDFEELQKSATKGDPVAQYIMGEIYYYGDGVAENKTEAARWYRLSANQGHLDSQYFLGFMHYNGEGASQDKVEAAKWYRMAALQDDPFAQLMLGHMYLHGEGVLKDDEEGLKWLKQSGNFTKAGVSKDVNVASDNNYSFYKLLYNSMSLFYPPTFDRSKMQHKKIKNIDVCEGNLDVLGGVVIGTAATPFLAGKSVLMVISSPGIFFATAPQAGAVIREITLTGATVYVGAKDYCYLFNDKIRTLETADAK